MYDIFSWLYWHLEYSEAGLEETVEGGAWVLVLESAAEYLHP